MSNHKPDTPQFLRLHADILGVVNGIISEDYIGAARANLGVAQVVQESEPIPDYARATQHAPTASSNATPVVVSGALGQTGSAPTVNPAGGALGVAEAAVPIMGAASSVYDLATSSEAVTDARLASVTSSVGGALGTVSAAAPKDSKIQTVASVGGLAATGASIGTIAGPVGTAIGAGVGAVAGVLATIFD